MILSDKRITKALISMRGFAGWSASLLFAHPRKHVFSREIKSNIEILLFNLSIENFYLVWISKTDQTHAGNIQTTKPVQNCTGFLF